MGFTCCQMQIWIGMIGLKVSIRDKNYHFLASFDTLLNCQVLQVSFKKYSEVEDEMMENKLALAKQIERTIVEYSLTIGFVAVIVVCGFYMVIRLQEIIFSNIISVIASLF